MNKALLLSAAIFVTAAHAQDTTPPSAAPAPASPAPSPAAPAAPAAPIKLVPIAEAKLNLPDDACAARLTGVVETEFAVLPDGSVADIHVLKSYPQGVFDMAVTDAIAKRTYAKQDKPVKMHERMSVSFTDCRKEQLKRVVPTDASGITQSQDDCPALSAAGKSGAEAIEPGQGGRRIVEQGGAQVYSAPAGHCFVLGKKLREGLRLTATAEYRGFVLATYGKALEEVWVYSSPLLDTTPDSAP